VSVGWILSIHEFSYTRTWHMATFWTKAKFKTLESIVSCLFPSSVRFSLFFRYAFFFFLPFSFTTLVLNCLYCCLSPICGDVTWSYLLYSVSCQTFCAPKYLCSCSDSWIETMQRPESSMKPWSPSQSKNHKILSRVRVFVRDLYKTGSGLDD
jgi:hypothetical protein